MKRCTQIGFRKPVKGLDDPRTFSWGQCRGWMTYIKTEDRFECPECDHSEVLPTGQTRIGEWI